MCWIKKKNRSKLLLLLWIGLNLIYIPDAIANKIDPIKISLIGYTHAMHIELENVRYANKYEIRYSADSLMQNAVHQKVVTTEIEITDLKANTRYYVQARVQLKGEWSAWSGIAHCQTALFTTTVGTYNILSAQYDHVFPNNPWEERKESMKATILQDNNFPDILGIQEGMVKDQVLALTELLKNHYSGHISHRDISPRAIFWKPTKYDLLEFNDDIEVLDKDIKGYSTTRYVTYVRLKEKTTKKELLVINLHAPSSYSGNKEMIRNKLALNIAEKAKELSKKANSAPVFILGDFNALAHTSDSKNETAPMIMVKNGFVDTYDVSSQKTNAYYGTHDRITTGKATSGRNDTNCSKRIDYIFGYPKNRMTVSDYRIIIDFEDGSHTLLKRPIPSDHRPVTSKIHLYY